MSKLMTWSLKRPDTATFNQYKKLADGELWNSKNYVTVDESAPESWGDGYKSFVRTIEKYPTKFFAIGMHEFFVWEDGTISNMGYPGSEAGYDRSKKILNTEETEIQYPVTQSLRYLMHTYPNIRWSIMTLCTTSSSLSDRVGAILTPGIAQDTYIRQTKRIVELYQAAGFPIADVEVDFEKTTSPSGSWNLFRDLLIRVKNEVCLPTGTNLRVNLLAMTGDFTPSYYAWHDYRTLAGGMDTNGNQAIDEFQLMSYDFSWGGSAPGPSTPLWWLKEILDHIKTLNDEGVLSSEKVFIGNAGYGRRWPLSEQKMGVTLDYKQLLMLQNGMYVHNDGATNEDGNFYFRDQDFIPFSSFNDPSSDYSITYAHVYDMFSSRIGKKWGYTEFPEGADYITSYSSKQWPRATGVQAILDAPSIVNGNANYNTETEVHEPNIVTLIDPILDSDDSHTYQFYNPSKGFWVYDNALLACKREPGVHGADGRLDYDFGVWAPGTYKLIAVVNFPFFDSTELPIVVNGVNHTIGANLPDWYPYITNPAYHYYDCGDYYFTRDSRITVNAGNGASIGGFIVCSTFFMNPSGGQAIFPVNLQKMKKRGPKNLDGSSQIVDAKFPENMTITGEILRRPPRPAIIWEDMFTSYIRGSFTEADDITNSIYYKKANVASFVRGSGSIPHQDGSAISCVEAVAPSGFSYGKWTVKAASKEDYSYSTSEDSVTDFAQMMLNKSFASNIHVEVDMRIESTSDHSKYGIRIIPESTKGYASAGSVFRLNYSNNTVEYYDFDTQITTAVPMSSGLAAGIGGRYTLRLEMINNQAIFSVNGNIYLTIDRPFNEACAYGVHASGCRPKVYKLNVSTLDRYEPLEKIYIHADVLYEYGEVPRTVGYDEYGYLVYTGLPGDITTAVNAIPTDGITDPSTVPGRIGTIYSTEIVPEKWSLDYKNLPLVTLPSWIGEQQIAIEMKDSGIWFRTFYVGDAEGFSVAYNSDKIGFIKTSKMVEDYKCKGIAMWTLGQEDPQMYSYIYDV